MDAFNSTSFNSSAFNPHTQELVLTYPDGSTAIVYADEITYEHHYGIRMTAIFASQIGACGTLAVLMYVLGRKARNQLLLRLLNLLALILVIIRSILQIIYWTGPYTDFYTYFAYDNTSVPDSARATSVVAAVLAGVLQLTVLASLTLQLRAIFTKPGLWKETSTVAAIGLSVLTLGFFFSAIAENCRAIMRDEGYMRDWKHDTGQILFTFDIAVFSFALFWKLFRSIRKRSKMRIRQFGPLQILCIGSFQTMLIPCIFCIIESTNKLDGIGSLTSTITAMSLPMSSIWAALDAMTQDAVASSKWGILPANSSVPSSTTGSNLSSACRSRVRSDTLSSKGSGKTVDTEKT